MGSTHVVVGHLFAKGVTEPIYFFGWGFTWVPGLRLYSLNDIIHNIGLLFIIYIRVYLYMIISYIRVYYIYKIV